MPTLMTRLRRPALIAALLAAAVLPSCGSDPVTVGTGARCFPVITVEPNPVIASQNLIGSATAGYKITLTETGGLGGKFVFVNGSVFDPATGTLVALNYYDAADMVVFVGRERLEALESISFPQTASYTLPSLTKAATLTITVQLTDDRGNVVNASTLVPIE